MSSKVVQNGAAEAFVRLLIRLNLLDEHFSAKELAASGMGPLAFYGSKGYYIEEDAARIVADHLQLDFVKIGSREIESIVKCLESPAFSAISPKRWRELKAVPVKVTDAMVVVAMANPLDQESRRELKFQLGKEISIALALESEINLAVSQKLSAESALDLQEIIKDSQDSAAQEGIEGSVNMESSLIPGDTESPPIVRLVNKIFADAIQAGASDIHITPERDELKVRVRVDGIIQSLLDVPAPFKNEVTSRIKLLAGMDISEKRKPQDGRLRLKTTIGIRDLRLSTVPAIYGENIVVRILSSDERKFDFNVLGLPDKIREQIFKTVEGSSRVVLVSGPTGSGKSSTLYATLLHLADGTTNIITVEDPIEYRLNGITQIQVNPKIGVTFAEGLRSILRQDPDVIMVGEIRDKETAAIAMQCAQTGHLVLSSIHTNNAPSVVTRLLDLGMPAYIIASSLGAVLAQRLVRRLCACAEPVTEAELEPSRAKLGLDWKNLRKAKGCEDCRGSGFKGRIGIYSFLEVNDGVRDAIRNDLGEAEIIARGRLSGYEGLEEAGLNLVAQGVTTLEEVERVLGSLHGFEAQGAAVPVSTRNGQHSEAGGLAKQRILLVEDDENTRAVLSLLLRSEMFDVDEAENGQDALTKVFENVPDLILCDLMMPRMDGSEFVKRLRRDARTKTIPFIMLTAADSQDNELKSLDVGVDDFISKTSDSKVMLARIHRLIGRAG